MVQVRRFNYGNTTESCNIFSYLINSIYLANDSYRVKLGRAVTFMKYLASIVSLIESSENLNLE